MIISRSKFLMAAVAMAAVAMAAPALAQTKTTPGAPVAGQVPINVIASLDFFSQPRLSPDGTKIALALGAGDQFAYGIIDLKNPAAKPVIFASANTFKEAGDKQIFSWRWVGNDHILLTLQAREFLFGQRVDLSRLVSYNVNTKKTTPLAWDGASGSAADILDVDTDKKEILLARDSNKYGQERMFIPEVVRVNIETGKIVNVVQEPNPIVSSWAADGKGVVRMGFGYDGETGKQRSMYRRTASDRFKTNQTVIDKDFAGAGITPEMIPVEGDIAIVSSNHEGFNSIYKANLATLEIGEKLFSVPGYDVDGVITNEDDTEIYGFQYTTDKPRVKWLEPKRKKVQEFLDEQFGSGNADIVSRDKEFTKLIISVGEASQPGVYYLYDLPTGKLSLLGWVSPTVKDGKLNPVTTLRYKASDGEEVEAIITTPRHRKNVKNLPVVVLTHGGPYGVRDNATYDSWGQAIAEQGYLVIQPNYRGSGGYGKEWVKKGRSDGFGTRMQDDLNDAVDQLAAKGMVDPKRACMMGWSYGGYASARAAQRDPQRWRCTIAGAGVYDLQMMKDYDEDYLGTFGSGYLAKGASELSAVSPAKNVNTKWSPILIVHGVRDPRVPINQARTLVSRLKAAGKVKGVDYDYIEQPRNGHYGIFFTKAERIEWLQGTANWLARWNPAFVETDADKPQPIAAGMTAIKSAAGK